MTRKMLTAAIAVTALLVSVLALGLTHNADAQQSGILGAITPSCGYSGAVLGTCADAEVYPGPFTNHPPAPTGPYGWGALNIVAGDGAAAGGSHAAGGGTGGGGLAHTGSESTVLGYVGVGLVAFGAVAMGSRRKFFQGALD